eukprot:s3000_g7.t1
MEAAPAPCSPVSECAEVPVKVIPIDVLLKRALGIDQEEILPFISSYFPMPMPSDCLSKFSVDLAFLFLVARTPAASHVRVPLQLLRPRALRGKKHVVRNHRHPYLQQLAAHESVDQKASASSSWRSDPQEHNQDDCGDAFWGNDECYHEWDVRGNSFDSHWHSCWDHSHTWWQPPSNRQLDRMRRGHSRRRAGQFVDFYNRKFGVGENMSA